MAGPHRDFSFKRAPARIRTQILKPGLGRFRGLADDQPSAVAPVGATLQVPAIGDLGPRPVGRHQDTELLVTAHVGSVVQTSYRSRARTTAHVLGDQLAGPRLREVLGHPDPPVLEHRQLTRRGRVLAGHPLLGRALVGRDLVPLVRTGLVRVLARLDRLSVVRVVRPHLVAEHLPLPVAEESKTGLA